mgnify:CR=1 FL=1
MAVQQLETMLGTRLLHRTTRKVQLTQDGQTFYERCQDLLADMDHRAENGVRANALVLEQLTVMAGSATQVSSLGESLASAASRHSRNGATGATKVKSWRLAQIASANRAA